MDLSNQLLRLREVIVIVKKSRATIYCELKAGLFPSPIRIGKRAVAWKRGDIEGWLNSRPSTR